MALVLPQHREFDKQNPERKTHLQYEATNNASGCDAQEAKFLLNKPELREVVGGCDNYRHVEQPRGKIKLNATT